MQIVINIPKEFMKVLNDIKDESFINQEIYKVISNGTVLPEGHGRLIDIEVLDESFFKATDYPNAKLSYEEISDILLDASPIIEADKLEREEKNKENEQ